MSLDPIHPGAFVQHGVLFQTHPHAHGCNDPLHERRLSIHEVLSPDIRSPQEMCEQTARTCAYHSRSLICSTIVSARGPGQRALVEISLISRTVHVNQQHPRVVRRAGRVRARLARLHAQLSAGDVRVRVRPPPPADGEPGARREDLQSPGEGVPTHQTQRAFVRD